MHVTQHTWSPDSCDASDARQSESPGLAPQLVLAFGPSELLLDAGLIPFVNKHYPSARIFGCSTPAGIQGGRIVEGAVSLTAIRLDHTTLHFTEADLSGFSDLFEAGRWIAESLPPAMHNPVTGATDRLAHVLLLSEGIEVNASRLVLGAASSLTSGVTMTGGLACDGSEPGTALVFRDGKPCSHTVSAIGFYGSRLRVGYGSWGGWDSFGPERLITRSENNVLYELDGKPALELYKRYLGERAQGLPATGLLFPLSIRARQDAKPVVRSFLSVNEEQQSLTFAADIPAGAYARLMKANMDRLIDAAAQAAGISCGILSGAAPDFALLTSCVGRRLVLRHRTEEEVESAQAALGSSTPTAGFYSHGEIAPFDTGERCALHNQTMSITTFAET